MLVCGWSACRSPIAATTGVPAEAAALGQRLALRGIHYLDATISGSSTQICGAETVVLAGGDP